MTSEIERGVESKIGELRSESNVERMSSAVGGSCGGAQ